MDFNLLYQKKLEYINEGLISLLNHRNSHQLVLDAMKYSIQAGGKRLRPILFLSAFELVSNPNDNLFQKEIDAIRPMACALEMIHTYSLIHDDLPAMDNDDYRRGKPTNHKVFGEAIAILAGDGLLNLAYEVMLEYLPSNTNKLTGYLKAMSVIANSAGISGMISGQSADIQNQDGDNEESDLTYIHSHKTEALITGALKAGVIVRTEDHEALKAISSFGKRLGLAFQITDDILDLKGNLNQLGKSPGSDIKKGKLTYPAIYGLERSKKMASQYIDEGVSILQSFGKKADFLIKLAISILNRNN